MTGGTIQLIWMALACSTIACTITKTPVFEMIHELVSGRPMLSHLMNCPYCMSHWVAFALVAIFQPMPFTGTWIDFIVCAFSITMLSTYFVQAFILIGKVIGKLDAD